ncbi:COR domain-containing protein [Candidatus Electronema sp. JM]|uniref:COR domain-containing protein n=1 Tax=Candidatus Electronema sp. JM TaxID=3401571 RepID=UPI003AA883C8
MTKQELLKKIAEAKASRATELDLSRNQLTALPPELFQLTNLTELDLRSNQLTALPPELFQLTNLTELDLGRNQLTALPPEICQLRNLQKLILWENKLTALPPELFQLTNLTELDLGRNQLTALPPEICQLTKLKELRLDGNPLISPPLEIAEKGIDAIREYFAELEKSKRPLNEVKVLLIGDGAAGKTSLVKQLFGQPFDKDEDTTHGISIRGWKQEVSGRKITINLWDFGGQEIQHATHQFFLSKRSLYVLVLDGRKDERTEYWLRHVEAFGGDSPVLVVLNKMDSNPSFDLNRPFLLEKYPGIRDFFRISCKTGKGVAEFRAALLEELNKVEMIGTVWPGSWFAVKRRLEEMDRPYISAAEYGGFCQEAGITEEQSRETLVDFLHDLGVAVHFREFLLDAMHVLDPVWVTEAVYKIITAESMADKQGCLHLNDMGAILPDCCQGKHCFPPGTHPYILRLMEKFELCYPVGKEAVLIPQLLPVQEPQLNFEQGGALRFALHYPDFLPPSVFPRFMVKVHKDIKAETCWRTGVLLEDKCSGAQALVKADVEARRINIWAQGERRREYLHYLRYTLADINSSFEKLTVSERVPMPDAPQVSADYETLLNLSEAGSDIFIPDGSKTRYSVRKLLGLVQPKSKDELTELMRKVSAHLDEKESGTEVAASLFELKPNIIGIGFNLNELFARILAWAKQRQRESRK